MIEADRLPTLLAPRVALRGLDEGDVEALFEIFSDPEVMRYWSSPPMRNRSAAHRLIAEVREGFQRRTGFRWAIARREDDLAIGTCSLFHLDPDNRRAEIGYALGRAHWGKGYMGEAL